VCACGAPVDVVEYDDAATSKAVSDVMAALSIDEAEARDLVGRSNPGAELTGEENARGLADQIVRRDVPGRDPDTYRCSNGHDDHDLHTSEERPLAVPPMIVQVPADVASRLAELEAQAAERTAADE
jgi:hypothetical protein